MFESRRSKNVGAFSVNLKSSFNNMDAINGLTAENIEEFKQEIDSIKTQIKAINLKSQAISLEKE